jgi:hypothetical protein
MKAVYICMQNLDEAFYLNGTCIIMNDSGAGDCNPVFEVAQQTAGALGVELVSFEGVAEPDNDCWDMREVYDSLIK